MVEKKNLETLQKQIEYYLSDTNLARDKFFREQIQTDKQGWVAVNHFLNCNKIKASGFTADDLISACANSTLVEADKAKKSIRRKENKPLPEKSESRKRDTKAEEKKADQGQDEVDENGKIILSEKDFDNPLIVEFKVQGVKEGDDFKVEWKQVENTIREKFGGLKIVYSRADATGGHIAFSQLRMKRELVDELTKPKSSVKIQDKDFVFTIPEGEELKSFWTDHGGHYQFCTQNKVRMARKQAKARQTEKKEQTKRAKTSYEIAGVYYLDINKVKSKSRAILNLKKDGEKLEGNDEEFLKELIAFHDKKDQKMKDFDHFEVNVHPSYDKTRCFFVVRKDGSKEDFSVTKCIQVLENQL